MVAHGRGALGEEFQITNRRILDGGDSPVWQAVAAKSVTSTPGSGRLGGGGRALMLASG